MPVRKSKTKTISSRSKRASVTTKAVKKSEEPKEEVDELDMSASITQKADKPLTKNKKLLIPLIIIVLAGFAYLFKDIFVVALVNGQPISRLMVINQLEKQSGKQVLSSLVTETLILQEANKRNVKVDNKEIDDEIKKIENDLKKQGQSLEQVLTFQGLRMEEVREQIKLQKLLEKMVGKDITITDKEVSDYIEKNKETLPQNQNEQQLKENVKNQLKQQKLSEKVGTFVSNLQQKATINYFKTY